MVLEATKRRLTLYAVHRTGTCRGPSTPPHKAKRPKLSHSHRWASRSPQEAFESDSNLNHLRNGESISRRSISLGLVMLRIPATTCSAIHAMLLNLLLIVNVFEKSMNGQLKQSRFSLKDISYVLIVNAEWTTDVDSIWNGNIYFKSWSIYSRIFVL